MNILLIISLIQGSKTPKTQGVIECGRIRKTEMLESKKNRRVIKTLDND